MTFQEILLDSYRRLNFSDYPDQSVTARLTAFANERHRRLLSYPGVSQLRDEKLSIQTVSGQSTYGLPRVVGRIKHIEDEGTETKLQQVTLNSIREGGIDSFGNPTTYAVLGYRPLSNPFVGPTALTVVSTSANDTCLMTTEVVRSGGYPAVVTTTLTGTANAGVGNYSDYMNVTKWFLSAPAAGYVSLMQGANTVGVIPPGRRFSRYLTIELNPIPSGVTTLSIDYTREIEDMTEPGDQPFLPPDFHYLIGVGIRLDEYEHRDDDRRNPLQREWDNGVRRLIHWCQNSADLIIVPGGAGEGRSSLGAWYPAGS